MPASPAKRKVEPAPGVAGSRIASHATSSRLWALPADQAASGTPRLEACAGIPGSLDGENLDGAADPLELPLAKGVQVEVDSTSCRVTSLITTIPGSAACCIRAAKLGTTPTIESRSATTIVPRSVTTTRPVWIPTRIRRHAELTVQVGTGVPHCHEQVEAASTARRASSS